ncbi:hypothetical protein FACS1894172_21370 [Spirochaetia bacterium]|nr:hypothetical protein FACS1894172_21370 [Spirochaetia bacterium]
MSNLLKEWTLSTELQTVLDTGLELWKYYHNTIKNNRIAPVDVSFYDSWEFFQGCNEKGIMNTKSKDETYNQLLDIMRLMLKTLTQKIQPKVYQYGFSKD